MLISDLLCLLSEMQNEDTFSFHKHQKVLDLSQSLHRLQDGEPTLRQQCVHTGVTLQGRNISMSKNVLI